MEARGDIGQSYIRRQFVTAFDATVAEVAVSNVQRILSQPCGGTGLPPVLELVADGITCGKYFGRASCSVLVAGATISTPFPPYAAEVYLGAQSQGTDERAPAQMERMRQIVKRATGKNIAVILHEQTGATCGDGQMCRGGPQAKHNSGASMNLLWTQNAKTTDDDAGWDDFHLFSQAGSDALMKSEMGRNYCNVLKKQEHLFALGQGKELRQSLAEYLDQPKLRILALCGHRKIGYISGGFGR
jgi:hypothetical protein